MASIHTAWKKTDGPVRYYDGREMVQLGDEVEWRGIFRKRRGIVNYVPGVSEPHGEMEHGGLFWVGVSFPKGQFTGTIVDPDTGCLRKKVIFLQRGKAGAATPVPPGPFE